MFFLIVHSVDMFVYTYIYFFFISDIETRTKYEKNQVLSGFFGLFVTLMLFRTYDVHAVCGFNKYAALKKINATFKKLYNNTHI